MKNGKEVAKNYQVILNLIQDLQRRLLPFINDKRGRSRIKYGMTSLCNHGSFTLCPSSPRPCGRQTMRGIGAAPALYPALQACGMTQRSSRGFPCLGHAEFISASRCCANRGFTLIELLVVVLIIGILAAVAVPQYQKAVMKSRFATLKPIAKAVKDAQEIYFETYGHYAGTSELADLDIDIPEGIDVELSETDGYDFVRANHDKLNNSYTMYLAHSENFANNIYCEALSTDDQAKALCVAEGATTDPITNGDYLLYLLSGNSTGGFTNPAVTALVNNMMDFIDSFQSAIQEAVANGETFENELGYDDFHNSYGLMDIPAELGNVHVSCLQQDGVCTASFFQGGRFFRVYGYFFNRGFNSL